MYFAVSIVYTNGTARNFIRKMHSNDYIQYIFALINTH